MIHEHEYYTIPELSELSHIPQEYIRKAAMLRAIEPSGCRQTSRRYLVKGSAFLNWLRMYMPNHELFANREDAT